MLVEIIEDDLPDFAAFQVDDDPHAVTVGLVSDIGDTVDLLVPHELANPLLEFGFVHLIGDFRDDDGLAVFSCILDRRSRT